MSPQIWSSKDVKSFRTPSELHEFLAGNGISCIFAVDAFLTYGLLRGTQESAVDLT